MLALFILTAIIQLFYFLYFFRRLATYEPVNIIADHDPVSIVICAHNESAQLEKNLPLILQQEYPSFEVIVVNDNSKDDTELVLTKILRQYPHLIVRNIFQHSTIMKGKKYPLTVGIRAASFENILLTDADCIPLSNSWIHHMAGCLIENKQIVLGYAPYRKYPGVLNKFIRYETFLAALQYLSYTMARLPYMGVGRNMAYRKKLFFDNNVYPKHPHLLSGDDDLLINQAATSSNTSVQINKESFIISEPKKTWDEFWEQKRRHVGTGRYYKFIHQLLLGLYSFSHLLFYCLFILVMLYTHYQPEAIFIFFIRSAIQGIIFFYSMKKLGEEDLFWYFPVMDILFLIYYVKLFPDVFQTKKVWR